jgi:DNA-binding NarL/FixJ family response regulator
MKQNSLRVLIVDDSHIVRVRLHAALSAIETVEIVGQAQDVEEARRLFQQGKPHAVILDIRMPGGNGIDVLRYVKEHSPHTMVIILTNFSDEHYRKACVQAGADYFLDKSNEFDTVSALLVNARSNSGKRGTR